jgi:hypothetical protein
MAFSWYTIPARSVGHSLVVEGEDVMTVTRISGEYFDTGPPGSIPKSGLNYSGVAYFLINNISKANLEVSHGPDIPPQ